MLVKEKCLKCGKDFERNQSPAFFKKWKPKFCSHKCFGGFYSGKNGTNYTASITQGNGAWCSKYFEGYLKDQKCCSKSCSEKYLNRFGESGRKISEATKGEKSFQWKGGKVINAGGYIL